MNQRDPFPWTSLQRLIAMALAVIGLFFNDTQDLLFAIFLLIISDAMDRDETLLTRKRKKVDQ